MNAKLLAWVCLLTICIFPENTFGSFSMIQNSVRDIFSKNKDADNRGSFWKELLITFGVPKLPFIPANFPMREHPFNALPRIQADDDTWNKVDDACTNEPDTSNLHYKGIRYNKDSEFCVMLIYDPNGIIAGIQFAIPKDEADTHTEYMNYADLGAAVVQTFDEIDYYVFTVYFVDPATICSSPRTREEVEDPAVGNGTGNGLWLQRGLDPVADSQKQPLNMETGSEELAKNKFNKEKCVLFMGRHMFEGLAGDDTCENIGPFFLLYRESDKSLQALGFVVVGNYDCFRFEYPQRGVLNLFLNQVPPCVKGVYQTAKAVTTMHVYFNSPLTETCPRG